MVGGRDFERRGGEVGMSTAERWKWTDKDGRENTFFLRTALPPVYFPGCHRISYLGALVYSNSHLKTNNSTFFFYCVPSPAQLSVCGLWCWLLNMCLKNLQRQPMPTKHTRTHL